MTDTPPSIVHPDDTDLQRIASALEGDHPDQKRIAREGLKWTAELLRKNADYGSSVYKVPKLAPDLVPDSAIRVRMSDKIERLENLLKRNREGEVSESLEDTMRDLGAYCLLWLCRPSTKE